MKVLHLELDRYLIGGRWQDVTAETSEESALVRLTGSILHPEPLPRFRGIPPQATTLAIHMDPKAALELAASILDLAQTMDWPLPPAIEALIAKREI